MISIGRGVSSLAITRQFFTNACSGALLHGLGRAFGQPTSEEERAVVSLAGGILQHGYQCGMIWGAALAGGAQAHHLLGGGSRAQAAALAAAQRLVEAFRARNQHVDCLELSEIGPSSTRLQMFSKFVLQGGTIRCLRMALRYAPVAHGEIEAALAEDQSDPPAEPVSCAAALAMRMGASARHATMAAGLAGGIGLSGGACGALGAAIWIHGLRSLQGGAAKVTYKAPAMLDVVARFLKVTDYEFECAQIVGRRFTGVEDHAAHLRQGGCARILEVLVAG